MTEEELNSLENKITEALVKTIKETVNGKIDRLNEKMDIHNERHEEDMKEVKGHIEEVKPILEAYNGTKAVGNLIKWAGGIILTVAATWALIIKQ